MTVTIRPVSGKAGKKAFLDVPFDIYRDDPNWVAPLYIERFEHLDPRKNPYFQHAEAQLFVAERDGMPVGRISAQLCKLRSERYGDGVGQFGFLDATDDPAVFGALVGAAIDIPHAWGHMHDRRFKKRLRKGDGAGLDARALPGPHRTAAFKGRKNLSLAIGDADRVMVKTPHDENLR